MISRTGNQASIGNASLQESRTRLTDILERLPYIFNIVSLPDYRIVFANRAQSRLLRVLGFPEGTDIVGMYPWEVVPDWKERFLDAYEKARSTREVQHLRDYHLEHDGSSTWWDLAIVPGVDKDTGEVTSIASIGAEVTERREVEHALRFTQFAVDRAAEGVFWVSDDGRFLYANEAASTLSGYSAEELLAMSVWDIDTGGCADAWREAYQQLRQRGSATFETLLRRKDGGTFPAEIAVNYVQFGGRNYSCAFARDITHRKQYERAIKESEQRYRTLIDMSPNAIMVTDLTAKITTVNQRTLRIHGYSSPDELIGMDAFQLLAPEDRPAAEKNAERLAAGGEIRNYEYTLLRKDGSRFPAEMSVSLLRDAEEKPTAVIAITRDITRRRKWEEALRASEARYRAVVEGQTELICRFIPKGWMLTFVNDAYCRYFGKTREELVGHSFMSLIAEEDRDEVQRRIASLTRDTPVVTMEERVIKSGGEIRWQHWTDRAVFSERGEVVEVQAVGRDITEEKQARELNDALNNINRAISSTLEFDEIMQRVAVESAKALGAQAAGVTMREEGGWVSRYLYGVPTQVEGLRIADEEAPALVLAAESREPLAISDLSAEQTVPNVVGTFNVQSVLFVPLVVKNETIGVIFFAYTPHPMEFTEQQTDFARKLSVSVSLALDNARLYDAERQAARGQAEARGMVQRQLDQLQKALVPPSPRIGKGYEIAAAYAPAFAGVIGGDFYDVFETEDGQSVIMIGDVSGKGIPAASLAAISRSTIHAFAYEMSDADKALTHANSVLETQQSDLDSFVTACLALLDPQSGDIRYSNAGHPPPAIVRADGAVEFLSYGELPLCLPSTSGYTEYTNSLGYGDKLVLYTDGISEARRRHELFGLDGIERLLREHGASRPLETVRKMVAEVREWTGEHPDDDIAVVVIERKPPV